MHYEKNDKDTIRDESLKLIGKYTLADYICILIREIYLLSKNMAIPSLIEDQVNQLFNDLNNSSTGIFSFVSQLIHVKQSSISAKENCNKEDKKQYKLKYKNEQTLKERSNSISCLAYKKNVSSQPLSSKPIFAISTNSTLNNINVSSSFAITSLQFPESPICRPENEVNDPKMYYNRENKSKVKTNKTQNNAKSNIKKKYYAVQNPEENKGMNRGRFY